MYVLLCPDQVHLLVCVKYIYFFVTVKDALEHFSLPWDPKLLPWPLEMFTDQQLSAWRSVASQSICVQ